MCFNTDVILRNFVAEVLDIHMPAWLHASVIESLDECKQYTGEMEPNGNYPRTILKTVGENALEWFQSTTPESEGFSDFWLDVICGGTTKNQDTHFDNYRKRSCAISTRPELRSGTIVLPEADELIVGYYSGELFEQVAHQRISEQEAFMRLLQGQKQRILQPANGQVIEFDANSELHCAPPLPVDTIRLFMVAEKI